MLRGKVSGSGPLRAHAPARAPASPPQAVPQLRTSANIKLFNAEMKQCDYDLDL